MGVYWLLGDWKNLPPKTKKIVQRSVQNRSWAETKPFNRSVSNSAWYSRYPWHNHPCKFWLWSVKRFLGGRGLNFPIPYRLSSLPLQASHYCTSVWSTADASPSQYQSRQCRQNLIAIPLQCHWHTTQHISKNQNQWINVNEMQHHLAKWRKCRLSNTTVYITLNKKKKNTN